jgi:hypothetical protein
MPRQPRETVSTEARPHTRHSLDSFKNSSLQDLLWDLITFDRLLTGPVIHLIYWGGLLLIILGGFSVIGGAVGIASREDALQAILLAVPLVVGGLLVLGCTALVWRSFCEFYVAVFRISDDLRAMRAQMERGVMPPALRDDAD